MDASAFRNNAFAGPDAYIGGGSCGSASMVARHSARLSMAGIEVTCSNLPSGEHPVGSIAD